MVYFIEEERKKLRAKLVAAGHLQSDAQQQVAPV
jgi:hypothetical protein